MLFFLFPSFRYLNREDWWTSTQSYKSKKEKGRRGGDAVAGATGAAAVVIMRLLLHCVYACVRTQRMCVWVHPPLSRQEARTSPSNTVPTERGRERERSRERERERERLKPHNALHAAGLKSCRFISSCSEGLCVSAHTHTHTPRTPRPSARETNTDDQAGKTAFFLTVRTDTGFTAWCVAASWEEERGELLYRDDRVSLIFDMLWVRQLPCLLLVMLLL